MSAYFLFLDPVKEAENAILPDIIKDTLDRLEDELAGVVEAAAGDEVRESVRSLEIPELFVASLCEQ